ncbi:hypothetical protein BJ165DRAFT_1567008 [Panaeolus papilionaceus]|nr:hypothetical protein BJ165DRAFT_1567008 [Panaeolus papilionaceus]
MPNSWPGRPVYQRYGMFVSRSGLLVFALALYLLAMFGPDAAHDGLAYFRQKVQLNLDESHLTQSAIKKEVQSKFNLRTLSPMHHPRKKSDAVNQRYGWFVNDAPQDGPRKSTRTRHLTRMKIKPTRTSHVKIGSSTHPSPSVAIAIKQPSTIDVVQNLHPRTKPQTTGNTLSQNIALLHLEHPCHNDKETPHSRVTRIYKKNHQLEKQVENPRSIEWTVYTLSWLRRELVTSTEESPQEDGPHLLQRKNEKIPTPLTSTQASRRTRLILI